MQHPGRVIAHLCHIGVKNTPAHLICEKRRFKGKLEMPCYIYDATCGDHRIIRFVPEESLIPLPANIPVEVEYEAHGYKYQFETSFLGKTYDREGWALHIPVQINSKDRRKDRRLVHSHETLGDNSFNLELDGKWRPSGFRSFPLLKISNYDLETAFHPRYTPMTLGMVVKAHLILRRRASDAFIMALLEVKGIYPWPKHEKKLTRLRFVDLPLDKRKLLTLSLAVWEERQTP